MPDLVLDLLKFVFLGILYIFIARAVRAIYLELKPAEARPARTRSPAPAPARAQSKKTKKAPTKAVVVEGDHRGKSFELSDEFVIGRSDKCRLVLDDNYVSQVHARIFARDDTYMVEDMGSTNGTYLNRRRITSPVEVQRGDRVKVGKTVLELRK
jgi:pSer/pThr/pTyr-binding forkhead associated (FHA) protein